MPELLVAPFAPEVEVDLADARHEAVRVIRGPGRAVAVGRLEPVALPGAGREALPESRGSVGQSDARAVRADGGDGLGERSHGADDVAVARRMLTEPVVWSRMPTGGEFGDERLVERGEGLHQRTFE